MRKGIIDRIEGDIAVIELDGQTHDFHKSLLPDGAQAGDAVIVCDNKITLDPSETAKRKQEAEDLMSELWED
ncbi:DUF3006 domain-containing protein [Paenibacillus apiarius]|uniref:DUF3006 domain-containing protein n=1 Tax=Paenibacillus apiarius TaxID=46240 RepID=A0ABT4E036_9BACL|nr:DUF3006 domain-containing protein [Paenibacillus apiarius]MCY9518005.1 DUF3006 domain-containing protein [Paenibacillus apiarius]MCY9521683.1 DUF3006 domain-containing protein [Paenibacillus apiarius]MCY9554309.1 DUF3006 domain-containing protein [Paenibacillus apiarius]MCY9561387.1 DUF3006 domain-containing protein [Paenibacillus apiarius]MCY9685033.1 DUF3006 domain-containing protein [Paenibacillus apiarius]